MIFLLFKKKKQVVASQKLIAMWNLKLKKFLYLFTQKYIGLSCILDGCSTHECFVTACTSHGEIIGSPSYAGLPNINIFNYKGFKTIFVKST